MVKKWLGALALDVPRYTPTLLNRSPTYLSIRNRNEELERAPDGTGYRCLWKWTSDLHAPKVFPVLGQLLYRRAFRDHPIQFSQDPEKLCIKPDVSFIIGHRGLERIPQLRLTLASIAGQRNVAVECIVVEQDVQPQMKDQLPGWVRYVHAPPPTAGMPYNRALAFNQGVKFARSSLLILHDNDMPVPCDYAAAHVGKADEGYEVINLKRFIFYLDRKTSEKTSETYDIHKPVGIEAIVQNLQAGGSIAITRKAYTEIGGMDESFVGWGGEDNEFWERAETRRVYPYGSLPLIHLWHAPQPGKRSGELAMGKQLYWKLSKTEPEIRIEKLIRRNSQNGATD